MLLTDFILLSADGLGTMIEALDKRCLLMVNGSDSLFLDRVVSTLTNAKTWIPLYVGLLYVVMKNNSGFRQVLYILACAGLCVLLAGSIDDMIVKPLVARWRPSHDPEIGLLVDTVDGYRGGRYGFFSAHASNTFSIAVFFCWLIRSRLLSTALVLWSLTNCWTRMYLGVHFPGDILVGLCWGFTVGCIVYWLYWRFTQRRNAHRRLASSQYTPTGYLRADCDVPIAILTFTLIFTLIKACIL